MPAPPESIEDESAELISLTGRVNKWNVAEFDANLRKNIVDNIIPIFKIANLAVLVIIVACLILDAMGLKYIGSGYQRIVDGKVIMAMIGGTTVQLGVLVVTIGGYLFPGRKAGR